MKYVVCSVKPTGNYDNIAEATITQSVNLAKMLKHVCIAYSGKHYSYLVLLLNASTAKCNHINFFL